MLKESDIDKYTLDSVLIGKRIRSARKEKRRTQEKLAEHCGCTPTHICNIENGKIGVSLELLFRISVCLDKRIDYFVMDHIKANPQIKIESSIAPKLEQCNTRMLDIVNEFIDFLLVYVGDISTNRIEKD